MNAGNELEDFHLSGNSPQQSNISKQSKNKNKTKVQLNANTNSPQSQSIQKRQRPSTPPNLSKNQAKKWRKNWEFEEKKRIKNLKQQQQQQQKSPSIPKPKPKPKQKLKTKGILPQYDNPHTKKKNKKKALVQRIPIDKNKEISMFAHLPQNEKYLIYISPQITSLIHPVILRAGLYYADGTAWGANTRCIIMLNAFLTFIKSFECSSNKSFARELLISLNQSIQFLNDCRPQSVSMGNTIRWLKSTITEIHQTQMNHETEKEKEKIIQAIREYVFKIETADKMICVELLDRISDGDVLLTYARSYVIEKAIIRAYNEGKKFKVVIVDARPHHEGKYLLRRLSSQCAELDISYTLINSVSYILCEKHVNKVILGAACMMSNGSVVSRNGTAMIALLAKHYKIPVMVCCETYKFSERVQIDSICSNELGDFDALVRHGKDKDKHRRDNKNKKRIMVMDRFKSGLNVEKEDDEDDYDDEWDDDHEEEEDDDDDVNNPFKNKLLGNWRNMAKLKMLNLKYDTTPAKLIKMVITELGVMPPSAAPVIIRECHKDRQLN